MIEVFNSRVTLQRLDQEAAELAARYKVPGIACSDSHSSFEIAMSFNALPAFETADELRAALPLNEWHGSRSTVFIHPHHPLGGVEQHGPQVDGPGDRRGAGPGT